MAKAWLEERWKTLIPALEPLGLADEAEIERICTEELAAWKARPGIKFNSLAPDLTATRNRLKQFTLTPANTWINPKTGKPEHISRKYMNFTEAEWRQRSGISEEKLAERQQNQLMIENPPVIVARAEKLLASTRWDDLVTGLAVVTGRRLTELLQTARFFPCTLHSLTFEGQLKRRDLQPLVYEIPVLVSAELVLSAWRRLRQLEDCTTLDKDEVSAKYSRMANETAVRHFTGLVPQREHENLHTHTFRAIYAHIARLWFCPIRPICPISVGELVYINTILGHYQVTDEKTARDFAATEHYIDYYISDGTDQADGRRGIRLAEPGIEVLKVFQKKEQTMSTKDKTEQEQGTPLTAKAAKTRGTFTVSTTTYNAGLEIIKQRNMEGTGHHDRLIVDLMAHDAIAHQLYTLLSPLVEQLGTEADAPVATLKALIAKYQEGGNATLPAGTSEVLALVKDEQDPAGYLKQLVERDRKFKAGIDRRDNKQIDYTAYTWAELDPKSVKTPDAANERYRRAVNAIIRWNRTTQDPLHRWFINSAIIRDFVGGRNENVRDYLASRKAEIDAHHKEFDPELTAKQNNKNMDIKQERDLVAILHGSAEVTA